MNFYFVKYPILLVSMISVVTITPSISNKDRIDSTSYAASISEANTTSGLPPSQFQESVKNYDQWIQVTSSIANVRTEPNLNVPIILKASEKSWFPVLDHQGAWYKIQIGTDQTGWISDGIAIKKEILAQHQSVKLKPNTVVYNGPDSIFSTNRVPAEEHTYIPLIVSGKWIKLVSVESGETVWVSLSNVVWEYGEGMVHESIDLPAEDELKGKTIVVDPGHGGKDDGATGKIKPIKERDVNLSAALVLEEKLKAAGANVILTRTSNDQYVSLQDRVDLSNQVKADLFVSIHQNMFPADPKIKGVNTYYYQSDQSEELAKTVQADVMASLDPKHLSDGKSYDESLHVLKQDARPSILVEGCFLSNPTELNQSIEPDYMENLASGIFHGILDYDKK